MSVPGIVQQALDGEGVEARIALGGEDELFVTPTRTLIYRGEGLLRDESIEEYDHDTERLTLSEGRRKTKVGLEYAIDGKREFTVPTGALDEAFPALIEGVLTVRGVLDPDEKVVAAYRFSELSLVVAERRLVKHVGSAVFDDEYEEFRYDDVTGLDFEDGSVAMQIVLTVDGRSERIKAPNDRASEVRTRLENALWTYYDVSSNEELIAAIAPDEEEPEPVDENPFGSGVDPLSAGDTSSEESSAGASDDVFGGDRDASGGDRRTVQEAVAEEPAESTTTSATETATADAESADPAFEEAGFQPADSQADLHAEVQELREAVERQNQLLVKQQQTIEQLIQELSRGR
jgi:hypothetical protein